MNSVTDWIVLKEIICLELWKFCLLIIISITILTLILNLIDKCSTLQKMGLLNLCFFLLLPIWGMVNIVTFSNIEQMKWFQNGKYQYKVKLNKNVNPQEFEEQYHIIQYKDGVYTIETKEKIE